MLAPCSSTLCHRIGETTLVKDKKISIKILIFWGLALLG
jgi:hypothetical protein